MGIYLVSVAADDWRDEEVLGPVAGAVDAELGRRGLAPFVCPEPVRARRRPGTRFEEKLHRPIGSFDRLCRARSDDTHEALLGWEVLLPVDLADSVVLPARSEDDDPTTVGGARRALAAARRLADRLALPAGIPEHCDGLDLGRWFDGPAAVAAATAPGPWSEDLDAAYYTAVYLRAAEHALRRGCPVAYS
ncbi:hypothetical protein ACIF6L_20715 [Kitasatospora sp. NPDC086009]|uniref:hypothetical protein n=1 Tax=unclassified Kitasatospora TaxID=2633591 RepID=UPI0036E1D163